MGEILLCVCMCVYLRTKENKAAGDEPKYTEAHKKMNIVVAPSLSVPFGNAPSNELTNGKRTRHE